MFIRYITNIVGDLKNSLSNLLPPPQYANVYSIPGACPGIGKGGGGPKSESLFCLLFNFSGGGGSSEKS